MLCGDVTNLVKADGVSVHRLLIGEKFLSKLVVGSSRSFVVFDFFYVLFYSDVPYAHLHSS